MKPAGYGEDRLVRELTQRLAKGRDVLVGVGDDCTVIGRKTDAQWQLLKTDCIIEGIHFLSSASDFFLALSKLRLRYVKSLDFFSDVGDTVTQWALRCSRCSSRTRSDRSGCARSS